MAAVALRLRPLDLLFFRGGRPFTAGLPGDSTLPTPQALLGLIRSVLLERNGANFGAMRGRSNQAEALAAAGCAWLAAVSVRGPFLEHPRQGLVFPAPMSLVLRGGGEPYLVRPVDVEVPGWRGPFPNVRPLWWPRDRSKQRPQYITQEGLRLFLCGNAPRLEQLLQPGELFAVEERTGIGIDPKTLATEEGVIYKTRKLALAGGVSFYAEIHGLPEEQLRHFDREVVSPWGGERHHVVISRREPLRWMEPGNAGSGRTLVYLATPCFDIAEGVPACLPREGIRAAATAGPVSLSGWDLVKGGPKPTRFGIDAGSVFFLENVALPASLSGAADSLAGYGFSLKGTWTYAQ